MKITNNFESKSRIWIFIHKDLKNENWPEDYNESKQLDFLEKMALKYNHPEIISFLKQSLAEHNKEYNSRNIFKFLCSFASDICPICGNLLPFKNFIVGFDSHLKCQKCRKITVEMIESKKDLYEFLIKNSSKYISCLKKLLKEHKKIQNLFIDFSGNLDSLEDIFLFLTDSSPKKCKFCGNPTKFVSFIQINQRPYSDFCSSECRHKNFSLNQKLNNTSKRMNDVSRKELSEKMSKMTKERIKEGIWTPEVTNSWCHSKIVLKYFHNGNLKQTKVRSSFEALFLLLHPYLEYEKLRIPYFDSSKNIIRNYIVDFIDQKNKKVYEIKPSGEIKSRSNPDKFKALYDWAKNNDYTVEIITEEFFKNTSFKISLLDNCDLEYKNKILHLLKYYKDFKIDYEN